MASRVHNYEADAGEPTGFSAEQDGYVVFDLFVRNFSGKQYIAQLNPKDEEAIYLTTDSTVTVAATGVANTGIENSVRVAFAQIGRVVGTTTDQDTITGITCTSNDEVTGICRTAQLWEPNDVDHVANAISWYDTACAARTGEDVTSKDSYGAFGSCGDVVDDTAYPTYAVADNINSSDNVDVYDGTAYNSYETTVDTYNDTMYTTYTGNKKLVAYKYFTNTMRDLKGTNRPTFMTFEPNSITKVRVYIYIEGQDIDNYDFASIGKKIAVKFGFTKERFIDTDIQYDGPDRNADSTPNITLLGDTYMTIVKDSVFTDPGAIATDKEDATADLTADIVVTGGPVDTASVGTYVLTYNVTDSSGKAATPVTRRVIVIAADTTKPVITLLGNKTVHIAVGATYNDAGAIATDNVDNNTVITNHIVTVSTVDTATAGSYTVTYNVTDAATNAAVEVTRTVIVDAN
jgi:hypothetical protein